jgi:hypothetical protein
MDLKLTLPILKPFESFFLLLKSRRFSSVAAAEATTVRLRFLFSN